MTAIVKHTEKRPPATSWLGLAVPGLGHLALGELIPGVGLLALFALWASVLVAAKVQVVLNAAPTLVVFALGGLALTLLPTLIAQGFVYLTTGEAPSRRKALVVPLAANLLQVVIAVCLLAFGVLVIDRLATVASIGVAATVALTLLVAVGAQGSGQSHLRNQAVLVGGGFAAALALVRLSEPLGYLNLALLGLCVLVLLLASAVYYRFTLDLSPLAALGLAVAVQSTVMVLLAALRWLVRSLPYEVPFLHTLHPAIAAYSWVGLGMALWWVAYRRASPRTLDDDERNSATQVFLRTFRRNRTGMLGLFGVSVLIGLTLLTPLIAPFEPDIIDVGPKNLAPNATFWMGTDEFGRDMLSRVLYGGRISLSIGFIAVSIAASIGTAVGAIAGYAGGWVDRVLMFLVDMLLSLPRLVLLLAIVGIFRPKGVFGIFLIVAILGFTAWMGISRIVRSQVLTLKQQDFVQAARALGMSSSRIVFRHLVPNALAPVIVYCSLAIGGTILAEAGLSFLGLGVPPPTSTWGTLVNDGRDPLRIAPWIATFPGLMIVAAVMSFNLLGDGLRDALDPKLRGHG